MHCCSTIVALRFCWKRENWYDYCRRCRVTDRLGRNMKDTTDSCYSLDTRRRHMLGMPLGRWQCGAPFLVLCTEPYSG